MEYTLGENAKLFANNYDAETIDSVYKLIKENPTSQIRIMPDYHSGKGCVIGTTMTIDGKVNPNHVGVDIGCGVTGAFCELTDDINLEELDEFIKKNIPSGKERRKSGIAFMLGYEKNKIEEICKKIGIDYDDVLNSCGTLGGGNHYIEIGKLDKIEDHRKYLVSVHSGSRFFGKSICDYHAKKAELTGGYLTGDDFVEYMNDMKIAVMYAERSRRQMLLTIIRGYFEKDKELFVVNSTHNYISNDAILRKGAIEAEEFRPVLIPLNMRDGVIFGLGKGNPDWNHSAPHGAGRLFSRGEAKRTLSMEEFEEEMKDVYSSCVTQSTLDESPMAYKSASDIIDLISPTVDIISIAKPIYNFKGA